MTSYCYPLRTISTCDEPCKATASYCNRLQTMVGYCELLQAIPCYRERLQAIASYRKLLQIHASWHKLSHRTPQRALHNKDLVQTLLINSLNSLHAAIDFVNRSVRTTFLLYTEPVHVGNKEAQYTKILRLAACSCSCSHWPLHKTWTTMSGPQSIASYDRLWEVSAICHELSPGSASYGIAHCEQLSTTKIWYGPCALKQVPLLHTAVHIGNRSVRTPLLLYTGSLHITNQIPQSATYWKLCHFFASCYKLG